NFGIDCLARLLDADTGKEKAVLTGFEGAVRALAFAPDGKTLVAGSVGANTIEIATGRKTKLVKDGVVYVFAFSADGKTLAVADGFEVRLLDPVRGDERAVIPLRRRATWSVVISPDLKSVATCGGPPNTVEIWDLNKRKLRTTIKEAIACAFAAATET